MCYIEDRQTKSERHSESEREKERIHFVPVVHSGGTLLDPLVFGSVSVVIILERLSSPGKNVDCSIVENVHIPMENVLTVLYLPFSFRLHFILMPENGPTENKANEENTKWRNMKFHLPCCRILIPATVSQLIVYDRKIWCTINQDLPVTGEITCVRIFHIFCFFVVVVVVVRSLLTVLTSNCDVFLIQFHFDANHDVVLWSKRRENQPEQSISINMNNKRGKKKVKRKEGKREGTMRRNVNCRKHINFNWVWRKEPAE